METCTNAPEKGTLYGVSVGPGDPENLTLKAVRVLKAADVIAAPSTGRNRQTALGIVADCIAGKPIVDCLTPMSKDLAVVARAHDKIADDICALLDEGKDVAFITLGDAGVYSTYYYTHERVVARGYRAEVVPGVTSFCDAAARLGRPLCEGSEPLLVVPVSTGGHGGAARRAREQGVHEVGQGHRRAARHAGGAWRARRCGGGRQQWACRRAAVRAV